jgi:tetratricopeptide (TPR) repeat protein
LNEESTTPFSPAAGSPENEPVWRQRFWSTAKAIGSGILFLTVWILLASFLPNINRELLTNVLRATVILIGGFLPAVIFGYFQNRRKILFIEYKQNLRRLGFPENAQIYRSKFDAIYGHSDMTDRQGILFQTPIIVATILTILGWVIVFFPPIVGTDSLTPSPSTLAYGFLGAYVFAIGSLVRQYVTDDLQQRYYASIVYRYLAVFVLSWLVTILFSVGTENAPPTSVLFTAFTIGFFPSMGIRVFIRLGTKVLNTFAKMEGFEEDYPLHLLQGTNAYHEDRLLLEGIENIQNLACANIVDLMLKTRFPVEQLVDWIDQALLLLHTGKVLPPILQVKGIRTATDFLDVYESLAKEPSLIAAEFSTSHLVEPAPQPDEKPAETQEQPAKLWHPKTPGDFKAIVLALQNDPNMLHIRYWRDHAFEALPEDVERQRTLGDLKLMQGLPDEAINTYDDLLRQFPTYHTGRLYRGLAYFAAGQYSRAADDYRSAIEQAGPKWANAHHAHLELGRALRELKKFNEAAENYWLALTFHSPFPEADLEYAYLKIFLKEYDEAIDHLSKAVAQHFREAEALANRGTSYYERWIQAGRLPEKKQAELELAEQSLRQAIQLKPDLLIAYLNLARVLEEQSRKEEARQVYSDALKRPESSTDSNNTYLAHLRRGNLFFEAQQYSQAITDYQAAVALAPDAGGYYNLGVAFQQSNQPENAVEALRSAVRLNDQHLLAYRRLGDLAFELDRLTDAADAYGRELKLLRDEGNLAGQAQAHLSLGRTYRRLADRQRDARRELQQAAEQAEKLTEDLIFTKASFEMGLLHQDAQETAEAVERFTISAELFDVLGRPRAAVEAGLHLARSLQSQGSPAEAIAALDTAEERLTAVFDPLQPGDDRLQKEIETLRQALT